MQKTNNDYKPDIDGLVFYDGDHFSLEDAALLGEKAWQYYENEMNEFGVK